jgi:hypothetical protein
LSDYSSGWPVHATNEVLTFQSPHIKVLNSVQEYVAMITTEFVQDSLVGRNVHLHLRHKFSHEVQRGSISFCPVSVSNTVPSVLILIQNAWSIFWPYDRSWNKQTNHHRCILGHYIVLSGIWLSQYSNDPVNGDNFFCLTVGIYLPEETWGSVVVRALGC